MKRIAVFGATSAIAHATAKIFAQKGASLVLFARDAEKLASVADDLQVRGAESVEQHVLDLSDTDQQELVCTTFDSEQGAHGCDIALIAYGSLGDQKECEEDLTSLLAQLRINFTSVCSLLGKLATRFEKQGWGSIAVISSVAGDRGRQSNYIYGSAKGGLNVFLGGLRNRLAAKNVNVLTIKPGFVDTPMTAHLKKGPLFVGPDVIARGIVKAIEKRKSVVYLPWFWSLIMLVIRLIPEPIFKRLKL